MSDEGILLYVGGECQNVQGRRMNLTGRRCFSAAYGPGSRFTPEEAGQVLGLLDSGAFSDPPEARLSPEQALERQLEWERKACHWWNREWQVEALVSYDLLIDEKWSHAGRKKERWSVHEAERAVRVTVDAAAWLATQRERLAPRRLCLACQGVDAIQYQECVAGVLEHARPEDWIGLGGWCILGIQRSWIPTFWASMWKVLPMIQGAGMRRVHIFGVMYKPVLGPLLWLCDQQGLTLSTDSSGPVLQATRQDGLTWEDSCAAWLEALRTLRASQHYREPPRPRQRTLWAM